MRFTNFFMLLGVGAVIAPVMIAGCGDDDGSGTTTTTTASSTTSGGSAAPCAPNAAKCNAVKSDCIALADNSAGGTFGLRMSQITITKPTVLGMGVVGKGVRERVSGVREEQREGKLTAGADPLPPPSSPDRHPLGFGIQPFLRAIRGDLRSGQVELLEGGKLVEGPFERPVGDLRPCQP